MNNKKKICVIIGSRANYGSIKSAMRAIKNHPELELQLVVGASALLDRYGSVVNLIEKDGFKVDEKVYMLVEGETLATMAKSTGLGLMELATIFEKLRPDVVLTVGDRFETMATAIAASYLNIPLAQTMGGEISGTIDESIRHAVAKLAHIHFPACEQARERIIRMGEDPENVHLVGCPRMDTVAEILKNWDGVLDQALIKIGVGGEFDLSKPFVLVSQHPVTTEYGEGEKQITETISAVKEIGLPVVMLWPNADAGSEHVARGIRKFREHEDDSHFHFFKNLSSDDYIKFMAKTACLIGNSSSAIREGAFLGTPAVNIGTRQQGRQRGKNVIDCGYDRKGIISAIKKQLNNGRYKQEPIYGDGKAGQRIADILAKKEVNIQKRMMY
ncbi:UDP-N-acetylglucosamine 2-epimerase (hydrolyzing) [Candidatus Peregrinibacteria bacterium]|nr:UDP-N-acetylglucosamine 2-epimerase (hydrolyzing) [Candidatus Peregrinibacteria bacterium]